MNVLIVSTNEHLALHILRCLSMLRITVHVMGTSKFHSIRLSRYCSKYIRYELRDLLEENDNIINGINDYCRQQKIDIIIPAGIECTLFVSKIRNRITTAKIFPLARLETLELLNNKWSFGELMSKNDIPCPKSVLLSDLNQLRSLSLEFPIIVKQLELEGGKGVVKLNSFDELETYMSSRNKFNTLPLQIQEYIPGIDMCLNVLAIDGKIIAWSIQKHYLRKNIIEFIKDDNILNIGRQIVSCCNYTGVACIDMRLDDRDKSVKIIECNPRFWVSIDISMLSGVNFPYLGMLIAQNKTISKSKDINYKEIRYLAPKMLAFETLKNLSLKDISKHNLYFMRQIICDPLTYGYDIIVTLYYYTEWVLGLLGTRPGIRYQR